MATILRSNDFSKEQTSITYTKDYYVVWAGTTVAVIRKTKKDETTQITYTWECYRTNSNELDTIAVQNPESLDTDEWSVQRYTSLPRGAKYGTYVETWVKTDTDIDVNT